MLDLLYLYKRVRVASNFASGTDNDAFFFHADADQLSVGTTSAFISNQTTTFSSGQWYHVAACRSGTTLRLFKNGTQVGSSVTDSTDWQQGSNARVGVNMSAGQAVSGYITDLRVVKGTAVYTSAFTAPTERLTAITNTSLLACHLPTLLTVQPTAILLL